jgi:hypothetical protein
MPKEITWVSESGRLADAGKSLSPYFYRGSFRILPAEMPDRKIKIGAAGTPFG